MTEERLREFQSAWGRADLETLMTFVADECVYSASVGPEPGETFRGREQVRIGFERMLRHDAGSVATIGPTFLFGDRGVSEWTFVRREGEVEIAVRGCDLFEFDGDLITRKDAFRKVAKSAVA